jgi:hypothetical protein
VRDYRAEDKAMQRNLAVLTLSLLACLACGRERRHELDSSQKKLVPSQASKPYFELTSSQQQTLREQTRTLTLGEKRASVIAHLGSFDREDLLAPKKALEWKCRALVYDVVKVDQSLSNVRDRQVHLVFNREDALVAVLSNVDGIPSRGDYAVCR